MRLVSSAIIAVVVVAAFTLGRMTSTSEPAAAAPMARTVFSHFECYTATFQGSFPGAVVQLTDQFQTFQTKVGPPELFCTPVKKKVISGPNLRVPPPADHLTCYPIQGPTLQVTKAFANQFEQGNVMVGTPTILCVPTHKTP
jgi:hypothetical protein